MKTIIRTFIILSIIALLLPGFGYAEVLETKTIDRNYEPIQINAYSLPDVDHFVGAPFSELFALAYHADTQEWVQIPFQIDEKEGGKYLFSGRDQLLYNQDEISVMVKDLGDRVSVGEWLNDSDAQNHPRYEIMVEDTATGEKGWLYIYRSSTYQDTVTTDYIGHIADDIHTDVYTVGHNSSAIMDHLSFPSQRGVRGTRIIDRQKARLVGEAKYLTFTIEYNKTENDLVKKATSYLDGPIRIVQQIDWIIEISLFGSTIEVPAGLTKRFYQYSMEVVSGQGDLDAAMGCKLLRQSIDIHSNFSGSKFYNQYNDGLTLNRYADEVVQKNVDIPGVFWSLVTKNTGSVQGSIIQLLYLSNAIGDRQRLYYCERTQDTDDYDPRFDHININTDDTGEDGSWGDIGLHLLGNIQGKLQLAANLFFFRDPVDKTFAAQLAEDFGHPMKYQTMRQFIDITPPSKTYLIFTSAADNSLTWRWLAPGDNGSSGGPAALYEMRFDVNGADGSDQQSIQTWWETAAEVSDLPVPGAPFESQSKQVAGLSKETKYYFCLRTKDDAGNYSEFSPVVSRTTTPVELVAFEAKVMPEYVELRWRTASESNNYGFEVQRQFENDSFERIGFVEGAGTTSEPQFYSFCDSDIKAGSYQYRLRQIDTDGQFTLSSLVQVTVSGPKAFALHQNYPNPFNAETTIKYEVPSITLAAETENTFHVTIAIYNVLGQHIVTLVDEPKHAGIHSINWDSRDEFGQRVSSGVYLIHFTAKSEASKNQIWFGVKKVMLMQ
ncbi:T9SS type A sorting domain-containing protein [candidate division KSB1 bacterium]|nr:T9SS type A sorting domain-containing protein [candidate division KSB1 bacterium]